LTLLPNSRFAGWGSGLPCCYLLPRRDIALAWQGNRAFISLELFTKGCGLPPGERSQAEGLVFNHKLLSRKWQRGLACGRWNHLALPIEGYPFYLTLALRSRKRCLQPGQRAREDRGLTCGITLLHVTCPLLLDHLRCEFLPEMYSLPALPDELHWA
jgi:hypothetical protein